MVAVLFLNGTCAGDRTGLICVTVRLEAPWGQGPSLFCKLLYAQHLALCMAYRGSINICLMNEQVKPA